MSNTCYSAIIPPPVRWQTLLIDLGSISHWAQIELQKILFYMALQETTVNWLKLTFRMKIPFSGSKGKSGYRLHLLLLWLAYPCFISFSEGNSKFLVGNVGSWLIYILTNIFNVFTHSFNEYLLETISTSLGSLWWTLLSWGLLLSVLSLGMVLKMGTWSWSTVELMLDSSLPPEAGTCFSAGYGLSFGTLAPKPVTAQFLLDYIFSPLICVPVGWCLFMKSCNNTWA